MRRPRGFTLVEIMVALGIFALVSITVYGRIGDIVRQSRGLEERTLATWVAQNRLAALTLEFRGSTDPVPTGRQSELVTLGGRTWNVTIDIATTSDAELRRVEVAVAADDGGGEPAGSLARLTGFLGRY